MTRTAPTRRGTRNVLRRASAVGRIWALESGSFAFSSVPAFLELTVSSPTAGGKLSRTFEVAFHFHHPPLPTHHPHRSVAEHDIEISNDDEKTKPVIITISFLAKSALVDNLVQNKIISCVAASLPLFLFRMSLTFFSLFISSSQQSSPVRPIPRRLPAREHQPRRRLRSVPPSLTAYPPSPSFSPSSLQAGEVPTYLLIATFLDRFAAQPEFKRIYLAGVDVDKLRAACPALATPSSSFYLTCVLLPPSSFLLPTFSLLT
jgi:hypothetical protein